MTYRNFVVHLVSTSISRVVGYVLICVLVNLLDFFLPRVFLVSTDAIC